MFLIDDSITMKDHWNAVIELFNVLAYIAKRLDDNRLEMFFTVSPGVKKFKNTTPAVIHLQGITPSNYSNIDLRLGILLDEYKAKMLQHYNKLKSAYRVRRPRLKPLSLYVLTDGAWPGGTYGVAPIRSMIEMQK